MIRRQPVLPAQEAEGATQHVTADPEVGALAGGDRHAPAQEHLSVRLAERGTRLDGEGGSLRIVVHARHQRGIDDDTHRRVRDKALEAVPSAADRNPQFVPHRVLHGLHHLLRGADEANVVGLACEPPVESPADQVGVPRVIRPDLVRSDPGGLSHRLVSFAGSRRSSASRLSRSSRVPCSRSAASS